MILSSAETLEDELLKLLNQVLGMLEVVCRSEEPVNLILEDYRDTRHLTQMIQQLVGVASVELKEYATYNAGSSVKATG